MVHGLVSGGVSKAGVGACWGVLCMGYGTWKLDALGSGRHKAGGWEMSVTRARYLD